MKKHFAYRMTAALMAVVCFCMFLPAVSIVCANGASDGYVIRELPAFRCSGNGILATGSAGNVFGKSVNFSPIDLTAYGYPDDGTVIPAGQIGLSFDLFIDGDPSLATVFNTSALDGQMEISSSGNCDRNEYSCFPGNLQWKFGEWNRSVVDLHCFSTPTGGTFDPKNFNFLRIYCGVARNGVEYTVKVMNVRVVDLTKTPPSIEDDPIGENTFEAESPEWKVYAIANKFDNAGKLVAGYSLTDYVDAHADDPDIRRCLQKDDWAPIIQSLVNGLSKAGGGTLFIKAGVYSCRTEITLPLGVTIMGEWNDPTRHPAVTGTVLAVYCGTGGVDDMPFLTIGAQCRAEGLAFWYPEQVAASPRAYAPTLSPEGYSYAVDLTFINSYIAVRRGPDYVNCGTLDGIFATALHCAFDYDCVIDTLCLYDLHVSPDYWIGSEVPGAPTGAAAEDLRRYLYYNATGMKMGRIDGVGLSFLQVDGYATGLLFADGSGGGSASGACREMAFRNCMVAINIDYVNTLGATVSRSTITDCEYGVWYGASERDDTAESVALLQGLDISATAYAVLCQQKATVSMIGCTIRNGKVSAENGWLALTGNTFLTAAPQVILEDGALSATLIGNTDAAGGGISCKNSARCPLTFRHDPVDIGNIFPLDEDEMKDRRVSSTKDDWYIVQDMDPTGRTDVTAALQAHLTDVGNQGGGTVYLPCGHYRLNGSVTVPAGVELRGCVDAGSIPSNVGTVFCVYATSDKDATVRLSQNSGLRAVTFHYPEQYNNDSFIRDLLFTPYPYAVQGMGENVYVVNVSFHNGYDGVDLATFRCDRHYVSGVHGAVLHNMITVGGGSNGGVLRYCHVNENCLISPAGYRWDDLIVPTQDLERLMQVFMNNRAVIYDIGNVTDELLIALFNYGGCVGMRFSDGATARVYSASMDYTTVCVDVRDAGKVAMYDLAACSFNKIGSELKEQMYFIRLGDDFKGRLDVYSLVTLANPTLAFCVQSGTLNVFGMNYVTEISGLAEIAWQASLNVYNAHVKRGHLPLADNPECVGLIGGFYADSAPAGADYTNRFYMLPRIDSWVAPEIVSGDVDGDTGITSTDARLVLQYYAKKIAENALDIMAADVDGDGDVTSTDARLILQYYAKKIDRFPVD